MRYEFKAKSLEGDTTRGLIEADSTADAQQELRREGYLLISISPSRRGKASDGPTPRFWPTPRVPKRELLLLTTQLAIMVRAGVDVAEALQQAVGQCAHPRLRSILERIHADVADGVAVSKAFQKQQHVFGVSYVASIAAGEATGNMDHVLSRMADVLRGEIKLRATFLTAMIYPTVLMLASSAVLAVLMFFVLPRFGKIFHEMEVPTPLMTSCLMDVSAAILDNYVFVALNLFALLLGLARCLSSHAGRRLMHGFLLSARGIRHITRSITLGRSFRLMGTLLQSGVPLLEAIQLCRKSIRNLAFRELFNVLEVEVLNGRGIGAALADTDFVPGGAAQMVLTAERTGKLGPVMHMVGEFYEEDGEQRLRALSRLLEPAIIVVMGGLVSVVVLSVMLPMLTLASMH